MKYFLLFILSLSLSASKAQSSFGSSVIDSLGKSQFYFLGQAHNNKANTVVERELLFALNKKWGLRYDILEYAHSVSFLINHYLQTGQDSLLKFINPEANFNFIRSIKVFNDSTGNDKKIRFYGLDFENRDDGKYTRKAVDIILQQINLIQADILSSLLRKIVSSSSKDLNVNLKKLKTYLAENEMLCRDLLKDYFVDVLLMTNARFDFGPNRDEAMIANFSRLYSELLRYEEHPLFFGSFGTGHVNPANNNSIAIKLSEAEKSPVRNEVCIIGVQYFNCQFHNKPATRSKDGNLDFLCDRSVVDSLSALRNDKKETISFLSKKELSGLPCNKAIEKLSGMIIARNFSGTLHWTWE